jgi:serine/threonine protein kinase
LWQVVHRDLKIENFMFAGEGRFVLHLRAALQHCVHLNSKCG